MLVIDFYRADCLANVALDMRVRRVHGCLSSSPIFTALSGVQNQRVDRRFLATKLDVYHLSERAV